MHILGINSLYHESAACLLRDGDVIAFAEEERFNRIKHGKAPRIDNPDQLPWHAMDYCLKAGGIDLAEVDQIGYSSNPRLRELTARGDSSDGSREFNRHIRRVPGKLRAMGFSGTFHWVDHHMAHAASTYFASPFADAAVLSIDGIGDANSTALFHGQNNRLVLQHSVANPDSIGFLWELVSMFLGFDIYDATKIMGLAAYGDPERFLPQFRSLLWPTPEGTFATDQERLQFWKLDYAAPTGYFDGLEQLLGLKRSLRRAPVEQPQKDIAAALQQVTDEVMLSMIRKMHEETGSKNLCLAGGVALNCVTNQRVFEEGRFEQLFVQPAAHDAGTAIGAAYYIWHHQCAGRRGPAMQHAYYGPEFSNEQIERALIKQGLVFSRTDHIEREVASLLAAGNVIGYFQGRMEMGPRALGNRSLLADPRNPNMRDMLNHKVKHREYFRPFAPSVLAEAAHEWFQITKPTTASDFMLMAYPVPEALREKIPAVIHCDGTARIQTVRRETNPRYHAVISEFAKLTGVPLVLNTSFNDSEPIVCSPDDAINTFLKTKIDYLAISDYLVSKAENLNVVRSAEAGRVPAIARTLPALQNQLSACLQGLRITQINGMSIVTDPIGFDSEDAVRPICSAQQFFLDHFPSERIFPWTVLDINAGSGVFSIAAARAGATYVAPTAAHRRAALFIGFNAILNGIHADELALHCNEEQSHPQSHYELRMGTLESDQPHHLDSLIPIFKQLEDVVARQENDAPLAQLMVVSPGDADRPKVLIEIGRQLGGIVEIVLNAEPEPLEEYLLWLERGRKRSTEELATIRAEAAAAGVTHRHLCLLRYWNAQPPSFRVTPAKKVYHNWSMPLPGIELGWTSPTDPGRRSDD